MRAGLQAPLAPLTAWLLPLFLFLPGLETDMRQLSTESLLGALLVIATAILSKLVVIAFAPCLRQTWRTAAILNVMLSCRGLNVLMINYKAASIGVFPDATQGALVLMALFSTAMTGPTVKCLAHDGSHTPRPSSPRFRSVEMENEDYEEDAQAEAEALVEEGA